jgi:hypothetical protein
MLLRQIEGRRLIGRRGNVWKGHIIRGYLGII